MPLKVMVGNFESNVSALLFLWMCQLRGVCPAHHSFNNLLWRNLG